MTIELDETLLYKIKRKPREDGLNDDKCIALNLFWRKHVKVTILAKVFRVSKNTIYDRAIHGSRATETNALIDKLGFDKAWNRYVTDDMVRAVNAAMAAEVERREKAAA